MTIYALRDIKSGKLVEHPFPTRPTDPMPLTFFMRGDAERYAAPNVTHDGKPTLEVVEFVSPEVREMGRGK